MKERVASRSFFAPASIAVVGASPRRDTPVNRLLSTLLARGYRGRVHPVTDRHSTVEGLAAVATPADLPEPVDLGIVAMPKELAVGACAGLADAGVRDIVVVSAGFAEAGPAGVVRQAELAALAADRGLSVLGPNCMGFINLLDSGFGTVAPCFASVAIYEPTLLPGSAAIVSQSGGVGIAAMLGAMRAGTGVSLVVSSGNEAVLDLADLLDHVVADGRSRVVLLYAEHFRRGGALLDGIERATAAGVGTVVLHGGRQREGALAAQSHTGAIATDGRVVRELLSGAGAWPVTTLGEAVEALGVLASGTGTRPRGRRVAALAASGGMAVLSADAIASAGLTLARPAESTKDVLRASSPGFAGPWNPVDITPDLYYRPELVQALARALAADDGVDSVLLCGTFPYDASIRLAEAFAASLGGCGKAVAAGWFSGDHRIAKTCRDNGLAYFTDLSQACGYLATGDTPIRIPAPPPSAAEPDADAVVTEDRVKAELRALGLDVPDSVIVGEPAGLGGLRPPVAVKALHGLFPHRAEAGVLDLNLADDDAVRRACARITARMRERGVERPRVLVEEMVAPGVELFVGGRVDPTFGRVGIVGVGGSGISDTTPTRLVSLRSGAAAEVAAALAHLGEKVGGQPLDEIVRVVTAVLDWWCRRDDLVELDVNPLIVNDTGIWIVDGLAVRGGRSG